MHWITKVSACFGHDDFVLGSYDENEKQLRMMIAEAREAGFTNTDIREAVQGFLDGMQTSEDHVQEQMATLREYLRLSRENGDQSIRLFI